MKDSVCGGVEFQGSIDGDGRIKLPSSVLEQLGSRAGRRVHVRIVGQKMSSELEQKGVSEEETERMGAIQLESRGQVVKFLRSQSVLKKHTSFRSRIASRARGIRL